MSLMYRVCTTNLFFLLLAGCGGSGLEGEFVGSIGQKQEVILRFIDSEKVELRGYWGDPLSGHYEKSSMKGQSVDSVVFQGPEEKPFKLRICYQKGKDGLEILSIHSRMIGPGARYISTEPDSTFSNGFPRLVRSE